jgi:hypothetical protein
MQTSQLNEHGSRDVVYLSSELSTYSMMIRVDDSYRVARARRIEVGSLISILNILPLVDSPATAAAAAGAAVGAVGAVVVAAVPAARAGCEATQRRREGAAAAAAAGLRQTEAATTPTDARLATAPQTCTSAIVGRRACARHTHTHTHSGGSWLGLTDTPCVRWVEGDDS